MHIKELREINITKNMSSPYQYQTIVHNKSIYETQQDRKFSFLSNNNNNNEHTSIPARVLPVRIENEEIIIEQRHLVLEKTANKQQFENNSYYYTQIIAALAVSLGPLAAGLGKGYTSPAIANMQDVQLRLKGNYTNFPVTDQQASWVASLSLLGAFFGGLSGGFIIRFGRKRILTLISLPYSLSWIITVFATTIETMFGTAFVAGFCCSVVSIVTQVYVSEISSPEIRGFLSSIQKISGHLGILISFFVGAYLDWRKLAMVVSIAPMMLFVTVIYIPETPSYLILTGRNDDAYKSLQWLRGPKKNIEMELETIRCNIETTSFSSQIIKNSSSECFIMASIKYFISSFKTVSKNDRFKRPLFVICGLMIFQRLTGANSFGFYAVKIFRQTFAGMNPHGGAISVAFVQLLASLISGMLIDVVGRIPLLIISSVFMSLALASFGSYVYYEHTSRLITYNEFDSKIVLGNTDWIPLLCVLVFTIAFSLGISPISSLLIGELFPLEYRGIGSSLSTSFGYFCAFLGVKTFIDFQELVGLHGAFWLYACISCVGLLFVVLYVPETKGKELDEMDPKYSGTYILRR